MTMYVLHTLPNGFIVDIDTPNPPANYLYIDRVSNALSLTPRAPIPASATREPIAGVIGTVSFLSSPYLVVITSSSQCATLLSTPIRQITGTKILPFSSARPKGWTAENEKDEAQYVSMLRQQLSSANYYFSYDVDLTLSMQRTAAVKQDAALSALPVHQRSDQRFYWNRYLCRALISAGADAFVLPLVNGYVFHQSLHLSNTSVSFLLISRRSVERSGRRFMTRGLDLQGHASNFAETEQVLVLTSPTDRNLLTVSSFLQTRGSVPLLWTQPVTLKYTPRIRVSGSAAEHELAFRRHFAEQLDRYGRNVCVNLINQKGAELLLVNEFTALVNTYNDSRTKTDPRIADDGSGAGSGSSIDSGELRLINWDFHHECKGMKFGNVSRLIALIGEREWQHVGYTQASVVFSSSGGQRRQQWKLVREQRGVFRTNCIDCLDRTNVVQAAFAQHVLQLQLASLLPNTLPSPSSPLPANVQQMLRQCWANNADAMSVQYSGTGALKTDFTRTGKRTIRGALQDGLNSLTRYYLNNFRDGDNQDRVDLFLGLYQPSLQQRVSPFTPRRLRSHARYQRSVLEFFVRFSIATLLLLTLWTVLVPSEHWALKPWLHVSAWLSALCFALSVLAVGSRLLLRYGERYVNRPLLRADDAGGGKKEA